MRSPDPLTRTRWSWIVLAGCALALAGCSDDGTSPPATPPDAQVAAELSRMVQAPATVGATLEELDLFQKPMTSLAEDAGIYQETPIDEGWTGGGLGFPAKSALLAGSYRSARDLVRQGAVTAPTRTRLLADPALLRDDGGKAEGDTISVEYFTGPDSTGLNALIETATPDLVRFVMLRSYPGATLGEVSRRDSEILIDTGGTLEDLGDDEYYRATYLVEMAGGEISTGTLEPVSGSGPMLPDVQVRATLHVDDPRFNPLQEWTEAVVILEVGDLMVEGDETIYSLEATVHWRSGADHHASVASQGGGPIQPNTAVVAVGDFTASPLNPWLETVDDTLRVRLGELEDENDDLLLEASRAAVFDGTASDGGSPRSYVHLAPDEPVAPGEEPCGGVATQEVWYPATWWLVHLVREADLNCDGSGSLHELLEMRDGTSYERTITWDGSGGATVSETRPDGTQVTGSFDEGSGDYSLVTTFPSGHDPVSRYQHGTALEGSLDAWEIVTWQDAHPDSTHFTAAEAGGITTVTGSRVDGGLREEFSLVRQPDGTGNGDWSRNDGASGQFALEMLDGGGRHLSFSAANPAEEGSPSLTGDVWYAPDGSGTGTITFTQYGNTVTLTITFGPDGSGTLDDGNGGQIPL